MRLYEVVGKSKEEQINVGKIELKVHASENGIRENKDITMQLAIGNTTNTTFYVSDTDVVTWIAKKIKLLTDPLTISVDDAGTKDDIAEFQFEIEGFMHLHYKDIKFKFQNESAFNKIDKEGNSEELSDITTLYDLLPNNEYINEDAEIENDPIIVSIKLAASDSTTKKVQPNSQTLTITTVTVTSDNNTTPYLSNVDILTWIPNEEMGELIYDMTNLYELII